MESGDSMKKQVMICCLLLSIVLAGCGRQENNSKDAQISNIGTETTTTKSVKNGDEKSLVLYFNYSDNVDITELDADAISSASLRVGAKGNGYLGSDPISSFTAKLVVSFFKTVLGTEDCR